MKRMLSTLIERPDKYLKAKKLFNNIFQDAQTTSSVLRLAFHDACTYCQKTKSGGPNARIVFEAEITHNVNKGLDKTVKLIQNVRKEIDQVSLADLIQIGGYAAIEYTQGPEISSLFRFGRKDLSDKDYFNERFYIAPNTNPKDESVRIIQKYGPFSERFTLDRNKGVNHIKDVFHRMGLNEQEIVALLGGNYIARAFIEPLSLDQNFPKSPLKFDNSYFTELLEEKETEFKKAAIDFALLATNEFRMWVTTYAHNQILFFQDYAKVHKKLSEFGCV